MWGKLAGIVFEWSVMRGLAGAGFEWSIRGGLAGPV